MRPFGPKGQARWRQPAVAVRVARILWITWAVLLWNVVLDHSIELAGRQYIVAAKRAANSRQTPRQYEPMDAWMRPAVTRGLWSASASAVLVLGTGFILLRDARVRAANR